MVKVAGLPLKGRIQHLSGGQAQGEVKGHPGLRADGKCVHESSAGVLCPSLHHRSIRATTATVSALSATLNAESNGFANEKQKVCDSSGGSAIQCVAKGATEQRPVGQGQGPLFGAQGSKLPEHP